jgi:membrane fusion protein, multidrug efflux system
MKSLVLNDTIAMQPSTHSGDHPDRPATDQQHIPESGQNEEVTSSASKRPMNRPYLALVVLALMVGVVASVYSYFRFIAPFESTDNASIEGHVIPIAPQISGHVAYVFVQDNQQVKQGDVLLEIDPSDYETRLTQARANLAAVKSKLAEANAQVAVDQAKAEQEKANVIAVEAEASRMQADLKRYQAVESRAISRSQLDLAQAQARSAWAQVEVAHNKALAAVAQAGLSKARIETQYKYHTD